MYLILRRVALVAACFLLVLFCAFVTEAQTTAFSYQGKLADASMPANSTYDFEFALYDTNGTLIGTAIQRSGIVVANGVFTTTLDFGESAFPGADRFLEIRVKRASDPAGTQYTILTPRPQINSSPYSIRASSAANADTATNATNAVNAQNADHATTADTATSTANATNANHATTADTATNATNANSATNFTGSLAGDVTGTQTSTVVNSVSGQTAANVASATQSVSAATSNNTVNTLVKRDAGGNFSAGTITANLVGNASTATTAASADNATNAQNAVNATNATNAVNAQTANSATTAGSATNFTGNLSGDVTGTQGATVVSSVGGQSAANVAAASASINTATSNNTANTFVKRDANGDFSAGTITANLAGNATTATTANSATTAATATSVASTAGNSVVTAINASGSSVNTANVNGDVELAPSAQQTTSGTNHLINLKLVGSRTLGIPGQDALLSLSASGSYTDGQTYDKERFRVDNDGSILSVTDYSGGFNTTAPSEGAGTRFMWYGAKAALRAGQINGTQWDDANIGLYSTAFGENVRALGDNAVAIGKNSVAAGSRTVAIGERNTATGYASVALGYGASTSTSAGSPRNGSFVFSDFSNSACDFNNISNDCQFHPSVTNSFNVRAVNGSFFYTSLNQSTGFIFNSTTATMTLTNSKLTMASDGSTTLTSNSGGSAGVTLPAGGGAWNNLSDRNTKDNFKLVDSRDILRKVIGLPISTWNYKTQSPSIRHIGAMAQDFQAAFKVGEDDKHISTIDPDGVALAAIQGLNEELKDRDAKIKSLDRKTVKLQNENDALRQQVSSFEARLKRLEQAASKPKRTVKRRK